LGQGIPGLANGLLEKFRVILWLFTFVKITCSVQHGDDEREVHDLLNDEDPDYQAGEPESW
jgi:hypothetical protein